MLSNKEGCVASDSDITC